MKGSWPAGSASDWSCTGGCIVYQFFLLLLARSITAAIGVVSRRARKLQKLDSRVRNKAKDADVAGAGAGSERPSRTS